MLKQLILIGLITISSSLFAQAGFDDDVQDVAVPVDGGITLVVAGAIAYGIRRNKQKTKAFNCSQWARNCPTQPTSISKTSRKLKCKV